LFIRSVTCSAGLLLVLLGAGAITELGKTYPTFVSKAVRAWRVGRSLTAEQRQLSLHHDTYQVLLYVRSCTPSDAVILLPPREYIIQKTGQICLLASPSSAYSFLHPRIPVHYGEASPYADRVTHLLVWEHWGLDRLSPARTPTEANRIALIELDPAGARSAAARQP
jgi:hypothetical protein